MLIIRETQMRAFALASRLARLRPYVEYVLEYHPDRAAAIGEAELPAYVKAALTRACEYGLGTNREIFRFLDLTVLFGPDWAREDLKWMHESLTDASISDPSRRLDRLCRRALFRLEAGV
jgi:hypothetical protein